MYIYIIYYIYISLSLSPHGPLWLFNIAMENNPFIDGLLFLNMVIFHGYVKYPYVIHIYIFA